MDDVSGNISKQWNKHHAIYIYVECKPPPRDVREGILCPFCDVVTSRCTHGVDGSDERFNTVRSLQFSGEAVSHAKSVRFKIRA